MVVDFLLDRIVPQHEDPELTTTFVTVADEYSLVCRLNYTAIRIDEVIPFTIIHQEVSVFVGLSTR